MAKTIWIIRPGIDGKESVLDKYVVVYENASRYYCKVQHEDYLIDYLKKTIEIDPLCFVSTGKENDEEIHAALKKSKKLQEIRDMEFAIRRYEESIRQAKDSIQEKEEKIKYLTLNLALAKKKLECEPN